MPPPSDAPADRRRRRRPAASSRKAPAAAPARGAVAAVVPVAWSLALGLAFLLFYLLLAPHAVADEDAGEITLALVTGGVIHPTGYPLFTFFGHWFVALLRAMGVGYAYAVDAWTSIGAAVAIVFLHRLALQVVSGERGTSRAALAAIPVALLGLNPQWVTESIIVEVNAWHVAWVCGAMLLFVRLTREIAERRAAARLAPRMLAWGVVCGVGAAHHTTALFVAAPATIGLALALVRAGRFRWWIAPLWFGTALVPSAIGDLGLLYRAQHPGGASIWPTFEPTVRGLVDHVTGAIYRGYVGGWHPDPVQAAALARDVFPFLVPALALSVVWLALARNASDRLIRGVLLAAVAGEAFFVFRYGVPDPVAYFLPLLALTFVGVAAMTSIAVAALSRAAAARAVMALTGAVALVLLVTWGTRAGLERRREVERYDAAMRSMWHAVPYDGGIFLWPSDVSYKLVVYQRLEGDRTHIDVYNTGLLCYPRVARQFALEYGFDPLVNNGPEHADDVVDPTFVPARSASWPPRYIGRVAQTIADSARVPIWLFDGTHLREVGRRHRNA